ncbi:MAG TPA: hypothetical protein VMZ28_27210 [Kofleriaceae bacterium]|nr:hypothetical protein [Kofleriaceae bacterium]
MKVVIGASVFVLAVVALASGAVYLLVHGIVLPLLDRRFVEALRKADPGRARKIASLVQALSPRAFQRCDMALRFFQPMLLMARGRFADARDLLEAERRGAPVVLQALFGCHLAWCFIELDDPERAIVLANAALDTEGLPEGARRSAEHTRAVAWLLTGRVSDGRAVLERDATLPREADTASDGLRWYWLGEARRLSGDGDARSAYERAISAEPDGLYRKRSETRLAGVAPYR